MSTMIALFLVLSTLAGCAGEALTSVQSSPPPDDFTVEVQTYEETFLDAGGAELAYCSYDLPRLLNGGEEVPAFGEAFASWRANGEALAKAAGEDRALYLEEGAPFHPYTDELRCTVYQTDRLVSVAGTYYTETGGAHGNTVLLSWNFDLETGEFFNPALLDEETGFHGAVVQALTRQARERAQENGMAPGEYFWTDYEDTLENWSSYAVSFDGEGMTVGFSPYELACYAAGPQIFRISYEDLSAHLGPHGRGLLGLEA